MIKKIVEIDVKNNINETQKSLEELNKELNELKNSLNGMDKNSDAFNSTKQKIETLTSTIEKQSVSNKKLEVSQKSLGKSVLDNGGAMGILNELTGGVAMTIKDAVEASDLFKDSMKGWKTALISTGIGALVVALGLIMANWDEIKSLVDGVSTSQRKNLEITKQQVSAEEDKLNSLNGQDNVLKLQGKSEKEILQLKINQTKQVIQTLKTQLIQEEQVKKAQVASAKRNQEILSGMLNWINIPLRLVLGAIDGVGEALGMNFNLVEGLEQKTKSIRDKAAGLIFDPESVAEEGDKTIKETKDKISKLENEVAGHQLAINDINKEAYNKSKEERDKRNEKTLQDQKESDEKYLALKKKLEDDKYQLEEHSAQEILDKQKEIDLEEINNLKGKSDDEKKILKDLLNDKYKILQENLDKENKLKEDKRQEDINSLISKYNEEKTFSDAKTTQEIDDILSSTLLKLEAQKEADLLKLNELGATEEQKKELIQSYTNEEIDIKNQSNKSKEELAKIEEEKERQKVQSIGQTLATASQLLGEHTVAGKAMAIAATTIDTFQSSVAAYKGMVASIPGPGGVVAGGIAAAGAIASGLATVKKIVSVKVPAKGGSGGGGVSTPSAPPKPSVNFANNPQTQISETVNEASQNRNQQPIKTYVVGNEVTTAQSMDRNVIDSSRLN